MKKGWISSDFKFEDINVGDDFLNAELNTISTVTKKTTNSIEMLDRRDPKNRYASGAKDADGVVQVTGRFRGFDCSNWYTMDGFNRTYKNRVVTEV